MFCTGPIFTFDGVEIMRKGQPDPPKNPRLADPNPAEVDAGPSILDAIAELGKRIDSWLASRSMDRRSYDERQYAGLRAINAANRARYGQSAR